MQRVAAQKFFCEDESPEKYRADAADSFVFAAIVPKNYLRKRRTRFCARACRR